MDTVFKVNPTVGIQIWNILDDVPLFNILLNKEWSNGCIRMLDIDKWKTYQIRYIELDNEYYLAPIQKYLCKNFEDIFGFGANCDGFNPNKIIRIRNAIIETL